MMDIKALAYGEKEYITALRRHFHAHPELGRHEVETTKRITEELEKMGIEVMTFSDITGCIGVIRGGHDGGTVALRADIDALPIQEADLTKEYASQNAGVMHACGHDCHTAMLLGAAKILSAHREEIHGTVKLLFQMAEEIGTESRHYVENGSLSDVDAIFGMHIWATLDAGKVNFEDGERMACSDRFTVKIKGKAAHGSEPDKGADAVVAAAAVVMGLQTLVSRRTDPQNTFVLTVGMMNGGTQSNIIAEEVELAQRIRKGDRVALEKLTRANLRFVVSVAKQYQNQGLSLPDLINEGNLGLIKAAEKFDETRGFKFISYAVWWIRQSILQALAEQSRIVRLPLNQVGSLNKISKAFSKFEQENERRPSPEELADELEIPVDKISDTLKVSGRHISVDAPFVEGEDNSLLDVLVNDDSPMADRSLVNESLAREIDRALSTLTDREKEIIQMFFGIGQQEMTLEEIGDKFGLTRERVRQIKEKAIRRLRQSNRSKLLKSYLG